MIAFVLRRLGAGVLLIVAISVIAFFLLYANGDNIARSILGEDASEETVAQKSQELGLDKPLLEQFRIWVQGALNGDFGRSWFTGQPVTDAIQTRLSATLSLVIGAILLVAILSVVLGVLAATRGGALDRIVQLTSSVGFAIPGFLIGLGLVLFFAIQLQWFRPTGYVRFDDSPGGWLSSITLPVVALSFSGVAAVTQQVRGSMLDALRQDYVRTLRSRGLSTRRVVLKHALRNAAGPSLAVLAVYFVGMLGGVVIIEQMFAIPGIGQVAVVATGKGDIPLVMGLVIAMAVLVIILNIFVDLVQGALNPRIRLS